jgi:hypothetical protein
LAPMFKPPSSFFIFNDFGFFELKIERKKKFIEEMFFYFFLKRKKRWQTTTDGGGVPSRCF